MALKTVIPLYAADAGLESVIPELTPALLRHQGHGTALPCGDCLQSFPIGNRDAGGIVRRLHAEISGLQGGLVKHGGGHGLPTLVRIAVWR